MEKFSYYYFIFHKCLFIFKDKIYDFVDYIWILGYFVNKAHYLVIHKLHVLKVIREYS